jgi:hypothetical protein
MEALKESAGAVAAKLKDPSWKMVLKDDPSEDRIITTSKYTDGKALLRRVLGTIADRIGMEDSEIANWASQIGQDIEEGKASREDMQIALQLAKRYQEDLKQIMSNPDAAKELRVSAFGKRKDLYGKIKDESNEFESWVGGLGEEEVIEGDEEMMQDEITADEEGMDMTVETEEVEETALDRVRSRVASRNTTTEGDATVPEMAEDEMEECGCDDNTDGGMSPMSMADQGETPQVAIMPLDDLQRILQIAGMK